VPPASLPIADFPALAYTELMKTKAVKTQPQPQKATQQAKRVINAGLIIWEQRKPAKTTPKGTQTSV
jgi:hypothetical protein